MQRSKKNVTSNQQKKIQEKNINPCADGPYIEIIRCTY
jgi:hypothetical protein